MLFWFTEGDPTSTTRHRFHSHSECAKLRAGMASTGTTKLLADTSPPAALSPCKHCWPVPKTKYFRPHCAVCETYRACPHNGGVPVRTRRGITFVWPDRAIFHEPLVRDLKKA